MKTEADGTIILEPTQYAILNYGPLLQTVVEFLMVAGAIFLAVKLMNNAKARFEKEKIGGPPPEPAEDILLLREIRDALKR